MAELISTREAALDWYRARREAIRRHLGSAIKHASKGAIRDASKRLGIPTLHTFVSQSFSETTLALDLVLFDAVAGGSRTIDRYARSNRFLRDSIDATVLSAMRAATFYILKVKRRHEVAGLIVEDQSSHNDYWLMDEGFEATLTDGLGLAARLANLGPFHTTLGSAVPLSQQIFQDALSTLADGHGTDQPSTDDPRLPAAIYAAAIRAGAMRLIGYGNDDFA